jgi:hypothetical protein
VAHILYVCHLICACTALLLHALQLLNVNILQSSVAYWWRDYLVYLSTTAPYNVAVPASGLISATSGRPLTNAVFVSSLENFLNTAAGAAYWQDIIPLNAPVAIAEAAAASGTPTASTSTSTQPLGGGLFAMRVGFRTTTLTTTTAGISALASLRALCAASLSSSSLYAGGMLSYPYAPQFTTWETQAVLEWLVIRTLLLEGGAMFLMLLVLLADIRSALLSLLGAAVMTVEVLGIRGLLGYSFSASTSHALFIIPGMSIVVFVYFNMAFLRCIGAPNDEANSDGRADSSTYNGSRSQRAHITLQRMGGPLIDYFLVMLLVVLILGGARSQAYFDAFLHFALVSGLGLFNGLLVLPPLLGAIGPDPHYDTELVLTKRLTRRERGEMQKREEEREEAAGLEEEAHRSTRRSHRRSRRSPPEVERITMDDEREDAHDEDGRRSPQQDAYSRVETSAPGASRSAADGSLIEVHRTPAMIELEPLTARGSREEEAYTRTSSLQGRNSTPQQSSTTPQPRGWM